MLHYYKCLTGLKYELDHIFVHTEPPSSVAPNSTECLHAWGNITFGFCYQSPLFRPFLSFLLSGRLCSISSMFSEMKITFKSCLSQEACMLAWEAPWSLYQKEASTVSTNHTRGEVGFQKPSLLWADSTTQTWLLTSKIAPGGSNSWWAGGGGDNASVQFYHQYLSK